MSMTSSTSLSQLLSPSEFAYATGDQSSTGAHADSSTSGQRVVDALDAFGYHWGQQPSIRSLPSSKLTAYPKSNLMTVSSLSPISSGCGSQIRPATGLVTTWAIMPDQADLMSCGSTDFQAIGVARPRLKATCERNTWGLHGGVIDCFCKANIGRTASKPSCYSFCVLHFIASYASTVSAASDQARRTMVCPVGTRFSSVVAHLGHVTLGRCRSRTKTNSLVTSSAAHRARMM